jgi:hypothetical protein
MPFFVQIEQLHSPTVPDRPGCGTELDRNGSYLDKFRASVFLLKWMRK